MTKSRGFQVEGYRTSKSKRGTKTALTPAAVQAPYLYPPLLSHHLTLAGFGPASEWTELGLSWRAPCWTLLLVFSKHTSWVSTKACSRLDHSVLAWEHFDAAPYMCYRDWSTYYLVLVTLWCWSSSWNPVSFPMAVSMGPNKQSLHWPVLKWNTGQKGGRYG